MNFGLLINLGYPSLHTQKKTVFVSNIIFSHVYLFIYQKCEFCNVKPSLYISSHSKFYLEFIKKVNSR